MGEQGLDDDKLSLLAKWAGGLRCDSRAEVAAAGRAIEMLIDEVERLNVLIWEGPLNVPGESRLRDERELPSPRADVEYSLRARLRRQVGSAMRRGSEPTREPPVGVSEEHRSASRTLGAS